MNFWSLLFLALGTLWLEALVIQLSALSALRGALRARWDALVWLERLCLARLAESSGATGSVAGASVDVARVRVQEKLLPEDVPALELLAETGRLLDEALPVLRVEMRREAERLGLPAHAEVLFVRERNARAAFEKAVEAYEQRRRALRMERVVAWFGYKPHSTVGRTPKVR
jgi:hypothetical protein